MNTAMTLASGLRDIPWRCFTVCDWSPDYAGRVRPAVWRLVRSSRECPVHGNAARRTG